MKVSDAVHKLYDANRRQQLTPKFLYLDPDSYRQFIEELDIPYAPVEKTYMGMRIVVVYEKNWVAIGVGL